VNNYSQRETSDAGFVVQIECNGETFEYAFTNSPKNQMSTNVVEMTYSKATGLTLSNEAKTSVNDKEKWGLKTNRFHKVKNLLLSPNHWDKPIGNKHFLFMLEYCTSDEETRPFFNEFLKEEFTPHKKFFEVLGSKLKLAPPANDQLSGIGFSDTQRSSVILKVTGSTFTRLLKINF
jgi:hypothetical protein